MKFFLSILLLPVLLLSCVSIQAELITNSSTQTSASDSIRPESKIAPPLAILIRSTTVNSNANLHIVPMGLGRGKLYMDDNGCIRLGEQGPLIIWHPRSQLDIKDGRTRIINGFGNNPVFMGDELSIGGGEYGSKPEFVSPKIPDACAQHGYWIAGPHDILLE